MNPIHRQYMMPQTNAIMVKVHKDRLEVDKFGFDRTVSTFQLLLKQVAQQAKVSMSENLGKKLLMKSASLAVDRTTLMKGTQEPASSRPTQKTEEDHVVDKPDKPQKMQTERVDTQKQKEQLSEQEI